MQQMFVGPSHNLEDADEQISRVNEILKKGAVE